MKIVFLYDNGGGWCVRQTGDDVQQEIRYWLGKSPGIHEMEHIFVVNDLHDYVWLQDEMRKEEQKYLEELEAKREVELFKRLKSKYEPTLHTNDL